MNMSLEVFKERLTSREMKKELTDMKKDKEDLCKRRLKLAAANKTPPWTMEQLDVILNS